MSFTYRFRKSISLAVVFAFTFGMTVTPAEAVYDPVTGRYLQRDPNGTALLIQATMHYQGDFPMVTVSPAYELQYGDGMNFYEYIQSNPPNRTDPSGLFAQRLITEMIGSAVAGYAFGLDAGVYALLDEGSESDEFDRALEGFRYVVPGGLAGGLFAGATLFSSAGNIAGAGIAGGFVSYGMGDGFESGYQVGAASAAVFEALWGIAKLAGRLGGWHDSAVVGTGAAAAGAGWSNVYRAQARRFGFEVAEEATANIVKKQGGRLGGPLHRAKVAEVARELQKRGWTIKHGGGLLPEELVPVSGRPRGRFPDITAEKNGVTLRVQVGKSTKKGRPVAREVRALNDLYGAQGQGNHTVFIPYD